MFQRYLRLHSPPRSRPLTRWDLAHFPRWVAPAADSPPSHNVSLGHDWPPTWRTPAYRESLLVYWEGGRRRRADYKGALPLPPALVEKSRGASLGACHHSVWKAFLKGSSLLPGLVLSRFSPPCPSRVTRPLTVLLCQSPRCLLIASQACLGKTLLRSRSLWPSQGVCSRLK